MLKNGQTYFNYIAVWTKGWEAFFLNFLYLHIINKWHRKQILPPVLGQRIKYLTNQ